VGWWSIEEKDGMASSNVSSSGVPKRIKATIAVLSVAVVILAGATVSYYALSKHYYDAKYRSQFELVVSIVTRIPSVPEEIEHMMNDTFPMLERVRTSSALDLRLSYMSESAMTVSVMYPIDSKERTTFETLGHALGSMQDMVNDYRSRLFVAASEGAPYSTNDTVDSLFESAGQKILSMADLLFDGFDSSRHYETEPYSLVKRMDLPAIRASSLDLEAIAGQIASTYMPY
jgi:hypothetical protein